MHLVSPAGQTMNGYYYYFAVRSMAVISFGGASMQG